MHTSVSMFTHNTNDGQKGMANGGVLVPGSVLNTSPCLFNLSIIISHGKHNTVSMLQDTGERGHKSSGLRSPEPRCSSTRVVSPKIKQAKLRQSNDPTRFPQSSSSRKSLIQPCCGKCPCALVERQEQGHSLWGRRGCPQGSPTYTLSFSS